MARVQTTQTRAMAAVLKQLRTELGLNERTCYEAFDPSDPPNLPPGGAYFVTVGFGSSQFPPDMQIGAGDLQCMESCTLVVCIFSRVKLDSGNQSDRLLNDVQRGLFPLKLRVLQALVNFDPVDENGNTFLRQTVYAQACSRPTVLTSQNLQIGLACLTLQFGLDFDLELVEPAEEQSESHSSGSSSTSLSFSTSNSSTSSQSTTSLSTESSSSSLGTSSTSSSSSPSTSTSPSSELSALPGDESYSDGYSPGSLTVSGVTDSGKEDMNGTYSVDLEHNAYRDLNYPQWSKDIGGSKCYINYGNGSSSSPIGWTIHWPGNAAFILSSGDGPTGNYETFPASGLESTPTVSI